MRLSLSCGLKVVDEWKVALSVISETFVSRGLKIPISGSVSGRLVNVKRVDEV